MARQKEGGVRVNDNVNFRVQLLQPLHLLTFLQSLNWYSGIRYIKRNQLAIPKLHLRNGSRHNYQLALPAEDRRG